MRSKMLKNTLMGLIFLTSTFMTSAAFAEKIEFNKAQEVGRFNYQVVSGDDVNKVYLLGSNDLNNDGYDDLILGANIWVNHSQSTKPKEYQKYPKPVVMFYDKSSGRYVLDNTLQSTIAPTQWSHRFLTGDYNGDGKLDVFISDTGPDNGPPCGGRGVLLLGTTNGLKDASNLLAKTSGFSHAVNVVRVKNKDVLLEFNNSWHSDRKFCEGYIKYPLVVGPSLVSLESSSTAKFQPISIKVSNFGKPIFDKKNTNVYASSSSDLDGDGLSDLVIFENKKNSARLLTAFGKDKLGLEFSSTKTQTLPIKISGKAVVDEMIFLPQNGQITSRLLISIAVQTPNKKAFQGNRLHVFAFDNDKKIWTDVTFEHFDKKSWEEAVNSPEQDLTFCDAMSFADIDGNGESDLICNIQHSIERGLARDYAPRVWLRTQNKFKPLYLDPKLFKFKSFGLVPINLNGDINLAGLEFFWDEKTVVIHRYPIKK